MNKNKTKQTHTEKSIPIYYQCFIHITTLHYDLYTITAMYIKDDK